MKKKFIILMMLMLSVIIAVGCSAQNDGKGDSQGEDQTGEVSAIGLTDFQTTDIYGEEKNQDIFKDYSLTMVNVWGTFCGPCIEEMPFLGELQKEYAPKGLNIVGIVVDVQDNNLKVVDKQLDLAKEIAGTTGAEYTHLIMSQELIDAKLGEITAIPASFFVDSDGNIVGETYVGARTKEEWVEVIEQNMEDQK